MKLLDPDVADDHRYYLDWDRLPARSASEPRGCDARIREAYRDGLHLSTVGREMGMTKNAVVGRARRLGLAGTHPAKWRF